MVESRIRGAKFCGDASEVSLISWNVLAPCYVASSARHHAHVQPSALDWAHRSDLILEELIEADADLVLLQEVAYEQLEELEARLASLGYSCVMQRPKKKGVKSEDHPTGNASFFKAERFELCWEEHRSRILLLDLRDKWNNLEICVANAHLEGDPRQPMARVSQVKSALQEASRRGGPSAHALVLAGDLNAPLISSAVASYLSFGAVLPGVSEFGMLVDVEREMSRESGHPYSMTSAYAPDPMEFSFTLRGSAGQCHMLDQIWFDSTRCQCQALRNLFRSEEHKMAVLGHGLPNLEDPSDHLPIGVILKIGASVSEPAGPQGLPSTSEVKELREEDLLREAGELLEVCPMLPEQRLEYAACEEAVRAATPTGKPSPAMLQVFEEAQRARQSFLTSLPEECQQILLRIEELKKQARKAGKRNAKDKSKDLKDPRALDAKKIQRSLNFGVMELLEVSQHLRHLADDAARRHLHDTNPVAECMESAFHGADGSSGGQGSRLEGKGQMAGTEAMEASANKQLLEAAKCGLLDEVKKLLQSRADLESRSDDNDWETPLHWAAAKGHRDVVQLLVEEKAEIESRCAVYRTPLHLAAEEGHRDVVQLLLETNAEIEATDAFGCPPLQWAVAGGHKDVVQFLLEKSAKIETRNKYGETPLHVAAGRSGRDIVQVLLDKTAEIEATDAFGRTPLFRAAGGIEVAQLLLEKNALIGTTDKDGQTPLSYASGKVVDVLLEHIPKQEAWSRSLVCEVLSLDNQEQVVQSLDMWPQKAMTFSSFSLVTETLESMKRAQLPERLRAVLASDRDRDVAAAVHCGDVQVGKQNLFWTQEVAVTLKVLPGVVGSDAVRNDFLQILANTPHDAIFETDAVQAMILAAWQQERVFTWLEIGSCIAMVMALCCSSYGFRHGLVVFATTALWLAAILLIKKTFDEIVQVSLHLLHVLRLRRRKTVTKSYINFDNVADIWYIVSGWVAICRQLVVFPSSLEKPWMAMFCALSWLRLLYCLRGETWMGPRLLPILSAIKDTFAFFMLMCICLAAATHAYYNLGVRDEPTPTYAAFMQVIRLGIFGDFDMFEFEGLDPTYALKEDDIAQIWEPQDPVPGPDYVWVHALFYTIGLGITVLLMNVLIGVLGANYERYEDRAVGQFFRARVNMLVELQCRPLRNVAKFRDGGLGWIAFCFRLLWNTLFVICSPCLLVLIALSFMFCQVSGVMYILRTAFGLFGSPWDGLLRGEAASECQIFFVVRDEPDINDVRSLRTELRNRIDAMQETFNTKMETQEKGINAKIEDLEKTVGGMNNKIEKHFAEMRELISGQTQLTQKDSLMEDQIEFKTSQSDPVSPQEVELDPYSRSSQDVSHEETKEVTKSTPKVKKKNRKLVLLEAAFDEQMPVESEGEYKVGLWQDKSKDLKDPRAHDVGAAEPWAGFAAFKMAGWPLSCCVAGGDVVAAELQETGYSQCPVGGICPESNPVADFGQGSRLEGKGQTAGTEAMASAANEQLLEAAGFGWLDEVKKLLQSRADLESRSDGRKLTPLHWAAEEGHRDVVQLLLEKHAEIEATDADGETPLHVAAGRGHRDIVQVLLEKTAEIEAKSSSGQTPLFLAKEHCRIEVLSLDNQEQVVKILDMWPQKAMVWDQWAKTLESMKRAQLPERLRAVLAGKMPPRKETSDAVVQFYHVQLGEQNLFWTQEVAVTLKVLPGVVGSDAVRNNFLQILADTPHDAIFETDAVQAMILAAWQQERIFTWLEIGSCIVMVMALCCSSYGFRHGLLTFATTSLWLAAILHIKKTFDEILQASPHLLWVLCCRWLRRDTWTLKPKRSYVNFDNIADIWYIVSGWVAIYRQLVVFPSSLEKPWMAMFCAFSWLRLLYSLRGETWMGPRLLPILSAIKDTFAFFVLMCICLAAAAHAYYNLGVRDEPTPTYAAFMQVIRLGIFGDFDMFEFEGLDPIYALKEDDADQIWEPQDPVPGPDYVWVHALFYIVGLGITVLLMNVLIGVLGANYERYEDRAVGHFFRARVNMLVELRCRPLRNLAKFRDGGLGWIGFCFRLLRNTLFVICSPCFLVLMALSCIFCQVSGVVYILRTAFGLFGSHWYVPLRGKAASECQIFFVVRDEPDINDVRSLRTELRNRIDAMQEAFNTKNENLEKRIDAMGETVNSKIETLEKTVGGMNNKIEKHFAEMRELISGQTGQTQLTQKDALMEDQIEFKTSPSDPVSPQEVELDSFSRSSQDVSHEETKEVTKLTPKVKKKNRKLVPRQTKTSSAPS
eukprot:symbB.v1.2.022488.t1/scaffold1997.1/size93120/1